MSLAVKREKIRRLLKIKQWQRDSDKALARYLDVSPATVQQERRRLIHAGLIPSGWGWNPRTNTHDEDRPRYRPYAPARGGYWWTPDGRTVRDTRLPKAARAGGPATPPPRSPARPRP